MIALWDFNIQCDHQMEHRRPDLITADKDKKEASTAAIAIPGDNSTKAKGMEKIKKYQDLKREIKVILV